VLVVLATLSVGVGPTGTSAVAAITFKACVATNTAGLNDKSFNAAAWKGVEEAAAADKSIDASHLASASRSIYESNIATLEEEGCGIIITVGPSMGPATAASANTDPTQRFAIVDDKPVAKGSHELLALQYQVNQGAFLGGYYAAATSTSMIVATYGSSDVPPVTLYMDGFVAGVRYYDQLNQANVKVRGFTPPAVCTLSHCRGKGTFVGNATNEAAAMRIAANEFAAGADVVFPVTGTAGLGAIAAAQRAGAGRYVIWSDTDGCATKALDTAQCHVVEGAVYEGVTPSVEAVTLAAAHGTFEGGSYVGSLENDGTGFAYDMAPSATLQSKIDSIAEGIAGGTISVDPNSYPGG
jgi:basic membrane protein A